ncbi:MAG: NADH:ubiquinone reductase (Na(+)-transporting) subunit C [Flavobacteriales bacterium]
MNKDSNGYTFGFAIVMVVVVGALLAFVSTALKPMQQENIRKEKMQNILQAVKDTPSRDEAEALFNQRVVAEYVLDFNGNVIEEGKGKAFAVDIRKEYKSIADASKRHYPLYECEKDGKKFYVIPVIGKGLWAAVWGYIALESDGSTVFGAVFDHESETPGLGAEIALPAFQDLFSGKKMIDQSGNFTSVRVVKPGEGNTPHAVDGISGGTFTSKGVDEMIERTVKVYQPFFNK